MVDVTEDEHPAIQHAVFVARKFGMGIDLFNCHYQAPIASDPGGTLAVFEHDCEAVLDGILDRLANLAAPHAAAGIDISVSAAWDTPLYEGVMREAAHTNARFILKETHYHSPIARALFSNTDWQLIRNCAIPVWLVKREQDWSAPTVLAAVDPMHEHDKPASLDTRILTVATEFARALGGEAHAVHVFDSGPLVAAAAAALAPTGPAPVERILQEAEQQHAHALARLAEDFGIPQQRLHMPAGVSTELLPHIARELDASLVVMGAVSRSRLEAAVVGSTAERALDQFPCDLLIIKPPDFVSPIADHQAAASYLRKNRPAGTAPQA